jgi:hypothetical protein
MKIGPPGKAADYTRGAGARDLPYAAASMRRLLTILAVAGAAAAAGCGGGDGGGDDEERITRVVDDYLTALASGNGERACAQLTPGAQKEAVETVTAAFPDAGGMSCEDAIAELSADTDQRRKETMLNPKVEDVAVSGDSATARVKGLSGTARLQRVEDAWKLIRNLTG